MRCKQVKAAKNWIKFATIKPLLFSDIVDLFMIAKEKMYHNSCRRVQRCCGSTEIKHAEKMRPITCLGDAFSVEV